MIVTLGGARSMLPQPDVAFDDEPDEKRFGDRIESVTVDAVFRRLERDGARRQRPGDTLDCRTARTARAPDGSNPLDTHAEVAAHRPESIAHEHPNQFALLGQRRFAPFFWTQFLGAGNDNLFKFAFTVLVTYQLQVRLAAAGAWPGW